MFNQSMCPCMPSTPTCTCCGNVVTTCNVENVPHYINYHTHQVNNCIKRHYNVPFYTTSYENVYIDEYQATPMMYGTPMYQGNMNNMYGMPMYQGNMNNMSGVSDMNNMNQTSIFK